MKRVPVLIPAYNPDERLTELVEALTVAGVVDIIVVDDGSVSRCREVFDSIKERQNCTLLRHAVNLGKGRALKTGFNYIYLYFPNCVGVVTADCDGQHRPEDILNVQRSLEESPGNMIMGVRKLKKNVPFRSKFGNVCTRFVFSFVIGKKVSDTQSGLRGIPLQLIPSLLKVTGERYEFEINMLIMTKLKSLEIIEVPIETIYLEENKSSHFNPFFDSIKIYFQLLRFGFSSLLASFFDFIFFTLMYRLTGNIMLSLLMGRFVVGSLLNFVINRNLVFRSKGRVLWSLSKYYMALLVMSIISWLLIDLSVQQLGLRVIIAKLAVESLLFLVSFSIQREFVFTNKQEEN